MIGEFVAALLGTLGGAGLAIMALRFLSGKFIEVQIGRALATHQHGLDQALATLQTQLTRVSDVLSRRNEREFAVTEQAWEKMIRAAGMVQQEFSALRHDAPDFVGMDDSTAVLIIGQLPFDDERKRKLRGVWGEERNKLYEAYELQYGVKLAEERLVDFKNWLSASQIFLSPAIHASFAVIRDGVLEVLSIAYAYASRRESLPTDVRCELTDKMQALNGLIDTLGADIRVRFGFEEDDRVRRREG